MVEVDYLEYGFFQRGTVKPNGKNSFAQIVIIVGIRDFEAALSGSG